MKIHVDMNQLLQNAAYISQQAQQYAGVYVNIYQLLDEMGTIWQERIMTPLPSSWLLFAKTLTA